MQITINVGCSKGIQSFLGLSWNHSIKIEEPLFSTYFELNIPNNFHWRQFDSNQLCVDNIYVENNKMLSNRKDDKTYT